LLGSGFRAIPQARLVVSQSRLRPPIACPWGLCYHPCLAHRLDILPADRQGRERGD
jgi:hypothetical protein